MRFKALLSLFVLCLLGAAMLPAADKESPSDDQIYDQVRRKLASDPVVKGGALEVDVKDGMVTLRGKVETEKQKNKAERVAKKVSGVKQVTNELTVAARSAR